MITKLHNTQEIVQMLVTFYQKTGEYATVDKIKEVITKFLTYGNLYAVVQNGQILSLLNLYCNNYESLEAYICNVYTLPECRQRGYARQLMQQAINHSIEAGFNSICLHVAPDNTPAVCLYKALGFELTGETKEIEGKLTSEMRFSLNS